MTQTEHFLSQLPPAPYLSSILVPPSRQYQEKRNVGKYLCAVFVGIIKKQLNGHNAIANKLVNIILNLVLIFADY